jgi:5-hydroxyisourate hydrolase-like protein (transthyretin family)
MQKRGQFFLIAAVIISLLIIGVGTVYISSQAPTRETRIYDLTSELDYEASQIIFNGVSQSLLPMEIEENIEDLATFYAKAYPDSDIAIFYGDETQMKAVLYETDQCRAASLSPPEELFFSPKTNAKIGLTIHIFPSQYEPPNSQVTIKLIRIEGQNIPALTQKEKQLLIELNTNGNKIRTPIKEFSKERVGNYDIAVTSLQDENNIELIVIPIEEILESKETLVVINSSLQQHGLPLSPEDITRVCFADPDGTFSPSEDISLAGREVREGTISPIGGEVEILFGDFSKTFELTEGQNFFVVIKKQRLDELTVATN